MNTELKNLKLLTLQNIRESLDKNTYKILGNHTNCPKCQRASTRDNNKKDGTISKKCVNDIVMYYIKKRYDNQSKDKNSSNINVKGNDPTCVSIEKKLLQLKLKIIVLR